MKALKLPVILLILLLSSQLMAKTLVAQFTYTPGFERFPTYYNLTIDDEGIVEAQIKSFRVPETKNVTLGMIEKERVQAMKNMIAKFSDFTLVDPKEGEAFCTVTPSKSWFVWTQNDVQMEIKRSFGCHLSQVNNWELQHITEILDGWFATLRL